MKKLLSLLLFASIIAMAGLMSSCEDEEDPMDPPSVTQPAESSVQVGTSTTISFSVNIPGGFQSATATATGGSTNIAAKPSPGSSSGNVEVEFTANNMVGAGSVSLSVTDNGGQTAKSTAVLSITESPVPSLEGIPATDEVTAGETSGPVTVTVTMEDAPGTLTITKNGTAYKEVDIASDDDTYEFGYPSTMAEGGTNITFEFTAEDSNGDKSSTVTHVLTVKQPVVPTKILDTNIDKDMTLKKDTIYELAGRITVLDGVTLTIEAGTVIKGQGGTGTNATALLVARGGSLKANGTADEPIIFTSIKDDIVPGQTVSPNLAPDVDGLWGGLIILGKAPISGSNDQGDVSELQIEGIPTSDTNGLYGGNEPADNSGTITYISIRHGGSNIGQGNEINGLTLGGVGSGTTIKGVEVVANQDDGIEWFGGNVNVSDVLIWNVGDDGLDTDQDWVGTVSNFIVVTPRGGSNFELDGPEGSLNRGDHTLKDGLAYSGELGEEIIDFDSATNAKLENIYFYGIPESIVAEDIIEDYNGQEIKNLETTLPDGVTIEDVFINMPADQISTVDKNMNSVGPKDQSGFEWTWASTSGTLSDIGL